jgi:hypothetical protein
MAENSPIQAKGVGKDAKRHDLDGTPGLSDGSSLNQGDVQQLEAGQKVVQDTQQTQVAKAAQSAGIPLPQAPAETAVAAPDPVDFAIQKAGGGLTVPDGSLSGINTAQWLPLTERLASQTQSSSMLRRAFVNMLSRIQSEPFAGSTEVVNKRELDRQVNDAF